MYESWGWRDGHPLWYRRNYQERIFQDGVSNSVSNVASGKGRSAANALSQSLRGQSISNTVANNGGTGDSAALSDSRSKGGDVLAAALASGQGSASNDGWNYPAPRYVDWRRGWYGGW
uniref:Uncharacterized protein n=1 Tax=Rhabditophanes sp. KR3021 TaxID=114890 RepID=A0AC35UEC6_9BILA